MGNIFAVYKPILHGLMKLAGVRTQTLEIEPGTVMNFWVPTEMDPKQSKPAVVFPHGFAVDGNITRQFQVLSLAKNYAVYVPDLLFFGGSITEKPDRSPEFQAECVAKGLRKLGVQRCTLVGWSYGGTVGFKMAELYPDLVESIVVTCSVMALTMSVSDAVLERIAFSRWSDYLLPDSVEGVRNMFEIAAYKSPHLPDWFYKHYLEVMFDNRKEREELLKALAISDEHFTVANYPQVVFYSLLIYFATSMGTHTMAAHQRVYLLWGENGKIFDIETATNLEKQIGNNVALDRIEKAGHLVQMERPFVYNKQLMKFLASST